MRSGESIGKKTIRRNFSILSAQERNKIQQLMPDLPVMYPNLNITFNQLNDRFQIYGKNIRVQDIQHLRNYIKQKTKFASVVPEKRLDDLYHIKVKTFAKETSGRHAKSTQQVPKKSSLDEQRITQQVPMTSSLDEQRITQQMTQKLKQIYPSCDISLETHGKMFLIRGKKEELEELRKHMIETFHLRPNHLQWLYGNRYLFRTPFPKTT